MLADVRPEGHSSETEQAQDQCFRGDSRIHVNLAIKGADNLPSPASK